MSTTEYLHDHFSKIVIRSQVAIALTLLLFLPAANFFFPTDYRKPKLIAKIHLL